MSGFGSFHLTVKKGSETAYCEWLKWLQTQSYFTWSIALSTAGCASVSLMKKKRVSLPLEAPWVYLLVAPREAAPNS